jgi:fluoroacetyl-CoA thioesterase
MQLSLWDVMLNGLVATLTSVERNEIICSYEARVGGRLIAKGETGQKILKKEKLEMLFNKLS